MTHKLEIKWKTDETTETSMTSNEHTKQNCDVIRLHPQQFCLIECNLTIDINFTLFKVASHYATINLTFLMVYWHSRLIRASSAEKSSNNGSKLTEKFAFKVSVWIIKSLKLVTENQNWSKKNLEQVTWISINDLPKCCIDMKVHWTSKLSLNETT